MKCPECEKGQYRISPTRTIPCRVCRGTGEIHDDHTHSIIVLRVPRSRKNAYVKFANSKGKALVYWMFDVCDRESGFIAGGVRDGTQQAAHDPQNG